MVFLFMVILIAGVSWAPNYDTSIRKIWRVFSLTFIPYFLARIFLNKIQQINRFLSTLLISSSLIGIMLMIKSYLVNFKVG